MRKGFLALMVATLLSTPAFTCSEDGSTGIVEENNLYIAVGEKNTNGLTEEDFNDIITKIENIYKPIIEAKGKRLQIARNWTDGTVNAYARQSGNTWHVAMFGGLARHETITRESWMVVIIMGIK